MVAPYQPVPRSTTSPALDMMTISLPPTATYRRRDAIWVPPPRGYYLVDREGTLTIVLQASRRTGAKVTSDSYAVQEELDMGLPGGVRSFLLENETEPDAYGPFRCIVGAMVEVCFCEIGWFDSRRATRNVGCKHRAALSELCKQGAI